MVEQLKPLKITCPGFDCPGQVAEDVANGFFIRRDKCELVEGACISVSEADALRLRDWLNAKYPANSEEQRK